MVVDPPQGDEVAPPSCKRSRDEAGSRCRLEELSERAHVAVHAGAAFWPSSWRSKLCTCHSCQVRLRLAEVALTSLTRACGQERLSAGGLSFLLDESDTVLAYENKGKKSEETRQHDPLMSALDSLNRVQQLEIIHGSCCVPPASLLRPSCVPPASPAAGLNSALSSTRLQRHEE